MRKINYSDIKTLELMETLDNLGFTYEKLKESLEVKLNDVKADKKRIVHELSVINGIHKTPPLVTQVVEGENVLSIYDSRM